MLIQASFIGEKNEHGCILRKKTEFFKHVGEV